MTLEVGDQHGGLGLVGREAGNIVDFALHVGLDIVAVRIVVGDKLHLAESAVVVTELFEKVNGIDIDVAAVLEGVKVSRVGTLPSQYNLVGIVGIAQLCVGGQGSGVGDTHGAIGITALHTISVNRGRFIDLRQTALRHLDGHGVGGIIVTYGKFAGVLGPCDDLVGTASVLKELDNDVVLVVLDALTQSIHIGILAQSRCLGGDRGQGTDDLVVHRIADRGGRSMCIAVPNVGQVAGILAGGALGLTHGLFEVGIAGLIFRIYGNIVVPLTSINDGHGQGHKEGIAGAGHIFGNTSLYDEIQTLLHFGCGGVAGGIRFGHGNAAVLDSGLQRVFDRGGIGSQCRGQLAVQSIAGKVVDSALSLVSVRSGQADSRQHGVAALRAIKAIQHTHLTLTIHQLTVHGDVGYAEVGELHTLDGVFCQLVNNGVIMQTGADVGLGIPRAVAAGLGDVVFVDGKGYFFAGVDGRFCERCGDEAQCHNSGHEQHEYAVNLFHFIFSFISKFLQK